LWSASPPLVLASAATRLMTALVPVAMLAVSRFIVDDVTTAASGHPIPARLWWWVGAECALALAAAILGRASGWIESLVADRFSYTLSTRVMRHAAALDLAAYEDPHFQDRLERARAQTTDRVRMVRAVGDLIQQLTLVLGFSASLALYAPWLTLVLACCIIPAALGESHFTFRGYALNAAQTARRREIDYLRLLASSPESAKELRLFDLAEYFGDRFEKIWREIYSENALLARARWIGGSLFSILIVAGYYACYFWIVWRAVHGMLTVGTMVQLTGAIAGTSANLQGVFATVSGLADEALFLADLTDFFRQQPRVAVPAHQVPMPRPMIDGFRFEDVSFRYPGGPSNVIDGLTMHLAPGECVALVGENGHGKSTIVKLLTRLYDPTGGRILLDGVDLRDYSPADLAREVSVIFQDFVHYDLTAGENIGLGHAREIAHDGHHERLVQAAEMSRALPIIEGLPMQFDQMLGRRFESGMDLSGGQWQKIALARAYLRRSQVLILDEPTSALDPQSEREVFDRLSSMARGRLTLLISHRFSTVRLAERILVIEGGRITEDGGHEALLEQGGRYAALFAMQAENYR
jgi:ATP-binding cassette subfamily B protein